MATERLSSVLGALYRRRLTILLITGSCLAASLLFSAKMPRMHLVKATVFVPKEMPRLSLNSESANVPQGPLLPDTTEGTRVGMTGLINSGAVHARVVELFAAEGVTVDERRLRKYVFGDIDTYQALVVNAMDRKPEMAVRLANAFVQAFRELMAQQVAQGPQQSLQAFEGELTQAQQDLEAAERRRTEFLGQLGTADLATEFNLWMQQRERILDNLSDLDLQERQLQAEAPALQAAFESRPEFVLSSKQITPNNAYYQALRAAADARTELAVRLLTYTAEHPIVRALNERVRSLDDHAAREAQTTYLPGAQGSTLDQIALGLLNQKVQQEVALAAVAPMRAALQAKQAEIEGLIATYPANKVELDRLDFDIGRLRDYLQRLSQRTEEVRLQLRRGYDVTYTDDYRLAELDDAKPLPTQQGILFFAIVGGLTLGVFVALLMETLARMRQNYPF